MARDQYLRDAFGHFILSDENWVFILVEVSCYIACICACFVMKLQIHQTRSSSERRSLQYHVLHYRAHYVREVDV